MTKAGFGKLHSLTEAWEVINANLKLMEFEQIPVEACLNRVLAEEIVSPIDVPHFNKSAMDGFAVIAADTFGAGNTSPKSLKVIGSIVPGNTPGKPIIKGECMEIATGAPLPEGADSILMVEYTEIEGDTVTIYKSVSPGNHVINKGTDVKQGTKLLEKGTLLKSSFTALLASIGLTSVKVLKRPRVAVLSTGNELLRPGEKLEKGKIYDINSRAILDGITEQICTPLDYGIVVDEKPVLQAAILKAYEEADMILVSGGSSLGTSDLLVEVIREIGEVMIHGIAIKPGKPTIIGRKDGKLIIGLPGHPASALSNFYIIVVPILRKMQGLELTKPITLKAELTRKVASTIGRYQFLTVRVYEENGKTFADPVLKGSSAITTLADADGFIEIEENVEVLDKGTRVKVKLF